MAIIVMFFSSLAMGKDSLTKKDILNLKSLIQKKYEFSASKKEAFIMLGGSWYKKVSRKDFFLGKKLADKEKPVNEEKLLKQISQLYKKSYTIFLRKAGRYYYFEDHKFKYMNQIGEFEKSKKTIRTEKKETESPEVHQCMLCEIRIAGNQVNIEGDSQVTGEVSWVPYYQINQKKGVALSFGFSSYSVENQDLEQVLSYGFKLQSFYRYLWKNLFVEAGGGIHYFAEFNDTDFMFSGNVGYIFKRKHWIFSKDVQFKNIYLGLSRVNWDLDILIAYAGVGISFY